MKRKFFKISFFLVAFFAAVLSLSKVVGAINTPAEGYKVFLGQTVEVRGPASGTEVCKKVTNNSCPGALYVPTKTYSEWVGDASKGFLTHVPACASVADCVNCDVDGDSYKNRLESCNDCDVFDHYPDIKQYRSLPLYFTASFGGNSSYMFRVYAFSSGAATSDGGFVAAGGYSDNTNPGYIAKFDCSGNKQWSRVYASTGGGFLIEDVEVTSDGGYIAVGNGSFNESYNNDGVIMKVNSSGSISWIRYYKKTNESTLEKFVRVAQVSGGYLAMGYLRNSSTGRRDGYIVKVDTSGNKLWSKQIGGVSGGIWGSQLLGAVEYSGGYIVVGNYGYDPYVVSLNKSNGNKNWSKKIVLDESYWFEEVVADGSYFVAAGSSQTSTGGIAQGVVYKFNSSGQPVWNRKVSSSPLHDIKKSSDGSYILGGEIGSGGMLVKINSSGSKQWAVELPYTSGSSMISAISGVWEVAQLTSGDYVAFGSNSGCSSSDSCYIGSEDKPWDGGSSIFKIGQNSTNNSYVSVSSLGYSNQNVSEAVFSSISDAAYNGGSYVESPQVTTDAYSPVSCQSRPGC